MIRSFRNGLAGTIAIFAAALALMTAAAAVPARADNDDLARALLAIGVVGLIAKTIDDNNDRGRDDRWRDDRRDDRRGHDRWRRNVLPAACAVDLRGRRGGIAYAEPCLRRHGVEGRLPYRCSQEVRIRGRHVDVFPERCLVDAGFRPERWRR